MSAYKEKKRSFFFWFLFAVILPILITGIIAIVILTIAGVDVGGFTKDKLSGVPGISTLVTSDEDKQLEHQLERANETITNQKENVSNLEAEISSLENIIDDLEMDLKKAKHQEKTAGDSEKQTDEDADEEVKKAAASFRKMDAEKAAQIIQNLDKATAIQVLSKVSGDVKGGILAEMEPKEAAELMEGMMQ